MLGPSGLRAADRVSADEPAELPAAAHGAAFVEPTSVTVQVSGLASIAAAT